MSIFFIDPLMVLPDQEGRLIGLWDSLKVTIETQDGFNFAKLLRAVEMTDVPRLGPFTHVSIIQWSCSEKCRVAFSRHDIAQIYADLRSACLIHYGFFETVRGSKEDWMSSARQSAVDSIPFSGARSVF
jgi:hypothetical protein